MADVAVVETNDEKAARGQLAAEVLMPGDHLRAEAHDQQHRRVSGVAESLVAEGDAPADVALLLGHDSSRLAMFTAVHPRLSGRSGPDGVGSKRWPPRARRAPVPQPGPPARRPRPAASRSTRSARSPWTPCRRPT